MSATNLTKNLKLPQFVASDKPSWLGDFNGAMLKIDNGYGTLSGDISKANDTASSAKSQSDANTLTLTNVNSELENQGNRITSLEAGGGTEQLEQRLQTVESDVTALQTRADTFEEEIAQNGTNITNLKTRVTTVEGKVKTNEDNITSLQTTTSGLSSSVESLTTGLGKTNVTANEAKNASAEAKSTATLANSTANSALSKANELESNNLTYFSGTITFGNSASGLPLQALYTKTQIYFMPLCIKTGTSMNANAETILGNFQLPTVVNNVLAGNGETYATTGIILHNEDGNVSCYLKISGQTATICVKSRVTYSVAFRNFMLNLPTIVYN
nr:MAG TPA: DNA stabilization protein [Caudoviricetes sp.]